MNDTEHGQVVDRIRDYATNALNGHRHALNQVGLDPARLADEIAVICNAGLSPYLADHAVNLAVAEVKRLRERAENAEAELMRQTRKAEALDQLKAKLTEADEVIADLEDARIADMKRMIGAENEVKRLRDVNEQLNKALCSQIGIHGSAANTEPEHSGEEAT